MDLDQIERIARAAREFTDTHEGVTVTIRIPTRHEVRMAMVQSVASTPEAKLLETQRFLLLEALVGWVGVKVQHFVRDVADESPVEHEPQAVRLLLDAQPDWTDRWQSLLVKRMAERRDVEESAEKKSKSASSGVKPKPMRSRTADRSLQT